MAGLIIGDIKYESIADDPGMIRVSNGDKEEVIPYWTALPAWLELNRAVGEAKWHAEKAGHVINDGIGPGEINPGTLRQQLRTAEVELGKLWRRSQELAAENERLRGALKVFRIDPDKVKVETR